MKISFNKTLRTSALVGALLLAVTSSLSAGGYAAHRDAAARQLKRTGSVEITALDENVRIGTGRDIVIERLGEPVSTLTDGSYMYPDFTISNSGASGVLVVRFRGDSVSDMKLVTPSVAKSAKANPGLLDAPVVVVE